MNDEIRLIRELLDRIENRLNDNQDNDIKKHFDFLEVPEIISDIVDYVQPLLLPYEAVIYWYMFRNSIIKNGDVLVRVSTRGLGKENEVIISSSGQSAGLSYRAVQKALEGLEKKQMIKRAGDTNRDGTLYRIFLADEIPICQELMKEKVKVELPQIDPKKEMDFYNVKENRLKIFERDGYMCYYCGKQLTRYSATLDHIQPVTKGGDNSYENLITSCLHCNSRRTNKEVMDIITKNLE